jgi:hypothetical protein
MRGGYKPQLKPDSCYGGIDCLIWKSDWDQEHPRRSQPGELARDNVADIEALKRLQARFRRMPADLYATKITEKNTSTEPCHPH